MSSLESGGSWRHCPISLQAIRLTSSMRCACHAILPGKRIVTRPQTYLKHPYPASCGRDRAIHRRTPAFQRAQTTYGVVMIWKRRKSSQTGRPAQSKESLSGSKGLLIGFDEFIDTVKNGLIFGGLHLNLNLCAPGTSQGQYIDDACCIGLLTITNDPHLAFCLSRCFGDLGSRAGMNAQCTVYYNLS